MSSTREIGAAPSNRTLAGLLSDIQVPFRYLTGFVHSSTQPLTVLYHSRLFCGLSTQ
jgi:hypothetical protein